MGGGWPLKTVSGGSKADITPEDGDIGTDFSEIAEKAGTAKETKPTVEQLPEVALSIDSPGGDYYSEVR